MQPFHPFSRRQFLSRSALTTSALIGTSATLPGFLARTAHAATAIGTDDGTNASNHDRILVIVQLSGGNDGLNTVIPYADDRYHRARPSLRIDARNVLRLNDTLGLHPSMPGFRDLHERGRLSVITNVGYPNPDRSHFRSMDIWQTANMDPSAANGGWLGRAATAARGEPRTDSTSPFAIHIDQERLPLALTGTESTPSFGSLDELQLDDAEEILEHYQRMTKERRPGEPSESEAERRRQFVERTSIAACEQAQRLSIVRAEADASRLHAPAAPYPNFGLAQRLKDIATLIGADFGSRVYYTGLSGFDTHARQDLSHASLLEQVSSSITAFDMDMQARGLSDRVMLMTFSEFGRRVGENGSRGTDHGAAAPMFVVGGNARPGIVGADPDLRDVQGTDGDVTHAVDFRSIYRTLLEDWLSIDARTVLGGDFRRANILS